jgi:hypothetical protein
MIDTTKIKDGLILLLIAGVAIGGFYVAKKVIDGVGNIGSSIKDTATEALDAAGRAVDAGVKVVRDTGIKAVEPIRPAIQPSALPSLTDHERDTIERMAAGGLGA